MTSGPEREDAPRHRGIGAPVRSRIRSFEIFGKQDVIALDRLGPVSYVTAPAREHLNAVFPSAVAAFRFQLPIQSTLEFNLPSLKARRGTLSVVLGVAAIGSRPTTSNDRNIQDRCSMKKARKQERTRITSHEFQTSSGRFRPIFEN